MRKAVIYSIITIEKSQKIARAHCLLIIIHKTYLNIFDWRGAMEYRIHKLTGV